MSLVDAALRHSRAAVVLAVGLVAAGLLAAYSLPSSIYPPLEFPRIVVIAQSGMLPPQSMVVTVTRPAEQAVMEVPGIRRVRSRTIRGATEISAQFDSSTDMVVALQQVQNRIAEIRDELPPDTALTVERMTPAVFPVFIVDVSGKLATADLNDYGQYVVRPEFARVPGAGRIEVLSSDTREIEVALDPVRLAAAGLTVSDVSQRLRAQNQLLPAGRFNEAGHQYLALVSGLWESAQAIAQAPALVKTGATIRVGDLGTVFPGSPDRTLLITGNGQDAVSISISQQIGASILALEGGLRVALSRLTRSLPAGIRFTTVYNLAEFVRASIVSVRDAILIGGVLATLILFAFLRDLRLTLAAALTLPLAVIPTFLFIQLFGGSINLMSMGGLAVAIGLVIDDAVVVVENIHRRAEAGRIGSAAAVSELMAPLVSSTLTTVVVFVPLGLLSGVTGQFFRALSQSLSAAVLLSLVWAVTVVPLLGDWTLRRHAPPPAEGGRLGAGYQRALTGLINRPLAAVAIVVLIGAATVGLYFVTGTGFLPEADEGGFVIDYLTPAGTALQETDRQVRAIEKILATTPGIAAFSRRTGSELGLFATAQNSGDILVRLEPRADRQSSSADIIASLRPRLQAAAPLAEIEFVQLLQDMLGDLEGNPTPIEVKIFGDDPAQLESLSHRVEELVGGVRGAVDVIGMQRGNPEATWTVDAPAAARFGLDAEEVGRQLSDAWLGNVATDLRLLDRRIPVRVRLSDPYRLDPARQPDTLIKTAEGRLVPVSTLASPARSNGQSELLRENLRGMALVTARLEDRDLGSAVAELQRRLETLKLPVGYTYEIGGQYASQRQAFRELLMVFGVATVLVFTILTVHFRMFLPALLVLFATPLALAGALLLLLATGTDLNVSSAMGVILLVGLTVKNGIMLFDFSRRLEEAGEPVAVAIAQAGRIRLRPILMTTLCTVFGLLPLALGIGAGAEMQRPLALAVIGGLLVSTPLTLLVVPALYATLRSR
jgi:CzcA family heavy metal efflux pump